MNINFIEIYRKFHDKDKLSNGDRAEIRRVTGPSDLETQPAFYKLLKEKLYEGERQWQRVVFFLVKGLEHKENSLSLGQAFKEAKINEKRIFQVIRSKTPNDLIQLRRLILYTKPKVDFQKLGRQLWYWGTNSKKQLLKDFYKDIKNKEKENNQEEKKNEQYK